MVVRVGCSTGVRIHEEHELDVAPCEKTVDVIILEGVDLLEVSGSPSDFWETRAAH